MGKQTTATDDGAGDADGDIDSPEWREARARAADVRATIGDGMLDPAAADALAARWGVSLATVWRRVRRYRRDRSIRAFLSGRPGLRAGMKQLPEAVEEVIRDTARQWWRQTENATIAEIYPAVVGACRARDMSVPSRATVARRLSTLRADPTNFVGEVATTLRARTRLMKASYMVRDSLAVVQIDHTVADVFIVDPVSRECIGRPTLTVAIDVATRSILGMCLSLEAPSALLVALCLEHAVFPKAEWLLRIGVDAAWPMHGQPLALHSDNGREFHSAGFRRGCDLNGIDTIYRPPGTPRFGGHIERLIGTLMCRVRLLPGSSYSDLRGAPFTRRVAGGTDSRGLARIPGRGHRAVPRPVAPRNRDVAAARLAPCMGDGHTTATRPGRSASISLRSPAAASANDRPRGH